MSSVSSLTRCFDSPLGLIPKISPCASCGCQGAPLPVRRNRNGTADPSCHKCCSNPEAASFPVSAQEGTAREVGKGLEEFQSTRLRPQPQSCSFPKEPSLLLQLFLSPCPSDCSPWENPKLCRAHLGPSSPLPVVQSACHRGPGGATCWRSLAIEGGRMRGPPPLLWRMQGQQRGCWCFGSSCGDRRHETRGRKTDLPPPHHGRAWPASHRLA